MPFQVFISSTSDDAGREYTNAVKLALWRIDEMPIPPPFSTGDFFTNSRFGDPVDSLYRMIDQCDLFIGVYGDTYGIIPAGYDVSHIELEYHRAHEAGKMCLIFMPEGAKDTTDERLKAFQQYLMENHVVNTFKSLDDLQSKSILAINNYKKTSSERKSAPPRPGPNRFQDLEAQVLPPAPGAPQQETTAASDEQDIETWVDQAMVYAEDDIERIVRRALEVHTAQHTAESIDQRDGHELTVRPIFGAPSTRSQFQADIFMIMPFREQFDSIYQNIIKPVAAELNLTIKRGDDFASVRGSIIDEVWAAINGCRLVIAETTQHNANVYYELGIAHTLGKPTVLLTQTTDADELPFDIRHRRFIIYENTIPGGEKLENELRRTILWMLNDLKEREAEDSESNGS